jgi:hypothetical protein
MNDTEKQQIVRKSIQSINRVLKIHGVSYTDINPKMTKVLIDCFVSGMLEGLQTLKELESKKA